MAADENALFELASLQQGFFTAKQAVACGYVQKNHHYYVKNGRWKREGLGIYRLAHYPDTEHPDLMYWYLWSKNRQGMPQGVFSHETALAIHELSQVMPASVHMTVPRAFSRRHQFPKILRIHQGSVPQEDVTDFYGVKVTTPVRTLIDIIVSDTLAEDFIREALKDAFSAGLIPSKQRLLNHPMVRGDHKLHSKIVEYLNEASI